VGRLTTLGSRLSRLSGGRLKLAETRQQVDRNRNAQGWRGWYGLKAWRELRWACLLRDQFTCRMCGTGPQADTSKLVADHKVPHRGVRALFFDLGNLETLCASPCHSSKKQAEELAAGL
jgi:5-methylcytosine-specific restriction enzyme A